MSTRFKIIAAVVGFTVASILTLCVVLSGGSGLSSPPAEVPQSELGLEAIAKGYTKISEEKSEKDYGVVMDSVEAYVGKCRLKIVLHHTDAGKMYLVSYVGDEITNPDGDFTKLPGEPPFDKLIDADEATAKLTELTDCYPDQP